MPIPAECPGCHKRFKANDKLVGKKVKCPQCGGVIEIRSPTPVPVPAPSLAGLVEGAATTTAPGEKPRKTCPACGSALAGAAVLCIDCGFDLRTGQKVEVGPSSAAAPVDDEEKAPRRRKKRRRERSGELSQGMAFLWGCVMASFGASIGILIWWAVAYFTWTEWAVIALVLGALSGTGMQIGYAHDDDVSGIAAAAIAFLGIIVAKALIFVSILGPVALAMFDAAGEDMAFDEGDYVVEESLGEGSTDEWSQEEGPGIEDISTPSAMEEADTSPGQPSAENGEHPEQDVSMANIGAMTIGLFFATMFNFWDILFIIVACGAAYKVGCGLSLND